MKEAAAPSVPQAWEATIIPVCLSQPIFSPVGPARKTQQHEGLDRGLVRPPAACPSMSGGLPCQGSFALPAGALASLSQASPSPVAWKTVKLNPEGSSHQRAGQTWPPPPPQVSPQGRLELGELCLGCLCCQLRARREKKNSQCCEKGWPRLFYPPSGLNPCCTALPPAMEKAFVLSRARLGDIVEQQRPAAATAARHSSPVCRRFVARRPFV